MVEAQHEQVGAEGGPSQPIAPSLWYVTLVGYGVLAGLCVGAWVVLGLKMGSIGWLLPNLDFMGSYLGAHLLVTGRAADLYDVQTQLHLHAELTAPAAPVVVLLFLYPGWNAVALAPLGALPYPVAFAIWGSLNLVVACYCAISLIRRTARTRREQIALGLVIIGFMPLWVALLQGQMSIMMWLGFTSALLAFRAGKQVKAGAWLLLGLVKPQVVLLPALALLVAWRRRAIESFAAGALILLGASWLALGFWIPAYFRLVQTQLQQGRSLGDNPATMHDWRGFFYHLLGTDTGIEVPLLLALSAVSVGAVVWLCWGRAKEAAGSWELRFIVAVILGLLISPHFFIHDTTILIAPGILLWGVARDAGYRGRIVQGVLAAGPFLGACIVLGTPFPAAVEPGSWYLLILLLAIAGAWPCLQQSALAPRNRALHQ